MTVLLALLVVSTLLAPSKAQTPSPVAVHGHVKDSAGNLTGGASVVLETAGGAAKRETKTDATGWFLFGNIPPGAYLIRAESDGEVSRQMKVIAGDWNGHGDVDLVLAGRNQMNGEKSGPASTMEFSDVPSFTVAAVTDWTAAGGHGSDMNLRASEALNRETASLKAGSKRDTGPGAEWDKEAEMRLRAEIANSPQEERVYRRLGELLLRENRFKESVGSLEDAYRLDPSDSDDEFELAIALKESGEAEKAREHIDALLKRSDRADFHRLAGQIDEVLGDPLTAVHELEHAAQEEPSEQNYFEWGSELLLHRAVLQAGDVFMAGVKAHPKSARMLTALGAALFANARYDEAAERLCEASDLNPEDSTPYLFMGKVDIAAPVPLPCIVEKLERFARLRPRDSIAIYYEAMAIWRQQGPNADVQTLNQVEVALTRATELDPKCSDAYFQLGNLRFGRKDFTGAIGYYLKAIEADGQSSDAHYRLGMAYDRAGEKEKAKGEFAIHDQIKRQQAEKVDRERREVKQFLVVGSGSGGPASN